MIAICRLVSRAKPVIAVALVILPLVVASCTFTSLDTGNYYALSYGVGVYDDSNINQLEGATNDGNDVRSMMTEQGYTLLNSAANNDGQVYSADVLTDLATAAATVGPDDIFIFTFSGHGLELSDESGALIAFSDYDLDTMDGSLTTETLLAAVEAIPSRHSLIIIDACNSGGFIETTYGSDGLPEALNYPAVFSTGTNTPLLSSIGNYFTANPNSDLTVIAAAGVAEESFEAQFDGYQQGVFTHYLLEAAEAADYNSDSYTTASEIYRYTYYGIKNEWNAYWAANLSGVATTYPFYPHISGGGIDPVIFR